MFVLRELKDRQPEQTEKTFKIIGELIVLASEIDRQLNDLLIRTFGLDDDNVLVEGLVATLDSARKIEIMRVFYKKLDKNRTPFDMIEYLKKVEKFLSMRNIAAHSFLTEDNDDLLFTSAQFAKNLKSVNIDSDDENDGYYYNIENFIEFLDIGYEISRIGQKYINMFDSR